MKISVLLALSSFMLFASEATLNCSDAVYIEGSGQAAYLASYPDFSKEVAFINAKVQVVSKLQKRLSSVLNDPRYCRVAKRLPEQIIETILKECTTKKIKSDREKLFVIINCKIEKDEIKSKIKKVLVEQSGSNGKNSGKTQSVINALTEKIYSQIR